MYIGSTGSRGLHHLVYEVLDNAIDEAQAGFATSIDVILFLDGSVSITDDGRGIPTDLHSVTHKSALETVLTVLHAGGKFGGESSGYNVSGGLHGVGVSVVNALSEKLEVTVWRDGKEWDQTFVRGKPVTELTSREILGESKSRQGTRVRFWPDKEVFITTTKFDYNTIAGRARELAFLNPQVKITLKEENENAANVTCNEYHYAGGLVEYVCWLNRDKVAIQEPISFKSETDGVIVDIALQWCSDAYTDTLLGYANSIRTSDGGSHMDGVKSALTRTLNSLGRKSNLFKKKDESLSGEHVREGLTGIISVKVPQPEFEGQTKTRLGNPEVRRIVDQAVQEYLTEYLECNPRVLKSILLKALNAYKAILPLRGKILNVERKREEAMYKNEEIQNIILGLGLRLKGEDFNKDALRYHKIIILTDADVDGAHICTLLLTFFFRYQKALFEEGNIYVGVPPLYKLERGNQAHYCFDDDNLKELQKSFPSNESYNIQRFKGLGEMTPLQLWETTLDPATRKLKQVTVEDAAEANTVFSLLMGNQVKRRKELITESASKIGIEKLDI